LNKFEICQNFELNKIRSVNVKRKRKKEKKKKKKWKKKKEAQHVCFTNRTMGRAHSRKFKAQMDCAG
jgi:hypothetical protein